MASRYWVGGTANWDNTAGTKWALTSGGAGGQAVPTSSDDVFLDAASGNVVVTTTATVSIKSLNCTGFIGTLAGTTTISVAGSITLVPAMTFSHAGVINQTETGTIISAGKTFHQFSVGKASGYMTSTLGDDFAATLSLTLGSNVTLDANDHNITTISFGTSGVTARHVNMGNGVWTLSGFAYSGSGCTLNAEGSTLRLAFSAPTLNATFTFQDLVFNDVEIIGAGNQFSLLAANCVLTCTNLRIDGPISIIGTHNLHKIVVTGNLTVNSFMPGGAVVFLGAAAATPPNIAAPAGKSMSKVALYNWDAVGNPINAYDSMDLYANAGWNFLAAPPPGAGKMFQVF